MTTRAWISVMSIVLALAGSTGSASARHYRHRRVRTTHIVQRPVYRRSVYVVRRPIGRRYAWRRHAWIMGNRRRHVYYIRRTSSGLPAPGDRVYFANVADARAAGYQPARRDTVPIDPRLTWRNKRDLPSLGTHREPAAPRGIQKPAAPPKAQQPNVTPTQPMPN